ncbi:MAG: hypothetical protein IPN09_02175 [Bacteroidetes bacterium]|nr:hypothetical protein [Bacteroidota bacterium]
MDNSIIENTNNIGIFSMHDKYDERNKPYKLVIDFLLSQRDTTAFATLKNALESEYIQSDLKKKLQLLHNIYEGGPQVKADDSIKEKVGDALGIFNNSIKISYDNKEKLHREALIVLRDALLTDV